MSRLIGFTIFVLFVTTGLARANEFDAEYQQLAARVKGGDLSIDFRALRIACAKAEACELRGTVDELGAVTAAEKNGDLQLVAALAERLVSAGYANMEAHAILAGVYGKLLNTQKRDFQLSVFMALLRSVQGDGRTAKTAFEVVSNREVFMVLTSYNLPYMGPGVLSTRPFDAEGHHYSEWTVRDATGQAKLVYFNLDQAVPAKDDPRRGLTAGGPPYRIGNGVTAPQVKTKLDPSYSKEALDKKIQGSVVLAFVVSETGEPRDITVRTGLGFGLDEKAIEAVSKWRFEPGRKDGKPVPVMVNAEVNFSLVNRRR